MKLSKVLWQTFKENPSDAEIPSHQLTMRAGLIHKAGSGLYNYMPFFLRSLRKVEKIVREELDNIGCQEIQMTVITPGELWQESGRWEKMGDLMLRFKDKNKKDLCISPTNEEAVVDIFRSSVKSYKDLPLALYQINTKFRDEIRPRFGLLRGREFLMKDAYSFHKDKKSLDDFYDNIYKAYQNIISRIGLKYIVVEADGGAMASSDAKTHEFQVLAKNGEDTIIHCEKSGYAANIEKAKSKRSQKVERQTSEPKKEVETPGRSTIDSVCAFLNIAESTSLKCLLYKYISNNKDQFLMVVTLGDDTVNEIKLGTIIKGDHLRMANDQEIETLGLIKGYIGPQGLSEEIKILFDSEISIKNAYVVGANKRDFHILNLVPERDCKKYFQADIRLALSSDVSIEGFPIEITKGIEVGHIFQLGDKYTKSLKVNVLGEDGKNFIPTMGCYGIGVTRMIAAAIEQSHDEKGIIWPVSIAPFQIYLVSIIKDEKYLKDAEDLYDKLISGGLEVLFDDRPKLGPGHKFKDAELLGIPLRVTFGERDFIENGTIEISVRRTGEQRKVKLDSVLSECQALYSSLK